MNVSMFLSHLLVLEPPGSLCSKTDGWTVDHANSRAAAASSLEFSAAAGMTWAWGERRGTLSFVGVAREALVHVRVVSVVYRIQ